VRALLLSLIVGGVALAQAPRIALVELYGVHKVSRDKILEAIGVREGEALSVPKTDIQDRVEKVPGVLAAAVEAVCCGANGDPILYVGIDESGAPHIEFRPAPAGSTYLPGAITETYHDFAGYFGGAARSGEPSGPAADAYRETFEHLARDYAGDLHRVVRESDDPEQRAVAAYLLGDGPVTKAAVGDLQYAMLDPDETVRANAMRSLTEMAPRPPSDPDERVKVEPTWFVELLNSLVWDDRYRASTSLVALTETRDPATLDQVRERALIDMARWRTPAHAHPAFVLLGRLAGLSEQDIGADWKSGYREKVIKKALKLK